MNLFVLAWNAAPSERERAVAALHAMHESFPLLDPSTASQWNGTYGFAAWMHSPMESLGSRRYVHASDDALVLYDGTIVASDGRFVAHDAAELAARWGDLPGRLDGHFVAMRLDRRSETMELVNDSLGIHTSYVCSRGGTTWISNSVRLLSAAATATTIDLKAVAGLIAADQTVGDRTLVQGITKLPPAQRWSWSGREGPRTDAYWSIAELAAQPKRSFDERAAAELAEAMTAPLRQLATSFPPLECPITAGRDSRLLAALTMAGDLPTTYFTFGSEDDTDVEHGAAIAARFGLQHQRKERPVEPALTVWDALSRRILRVNDGMMTLMHAQNALDVPQRLDHIPVLLYGGAGERARGKQLKSGYILQPGVERAIKLLQRTKLPHLAFVRADARGPLLDHIDATCRRVHDLGFAPVDLLDAHDLVEKDIRWGATQSRQRADHKDVLAPYLTQPFMQAAFSTPAAQRLTERVPRMLLEHLSPALLRMPTGSPWPARSVSATIVGGFASRAWKKAQQITGSRRAHAEPNPRTRARSDILLALLPRWRERFLDRSGSALWQVVDRERFEHVTSDRTPPAEPLRHMTTLFQLGTVFEYEADFAAWMERWQE